MTDSPDIVIDDLRGGLNDTDSLVSLLPGQCQIVDNVEFHCASRSDYSPLGTRRAGTSAITTPITAGNDVVLLHRHLPSSDQTAAELWTIDIDGSLTATVRYKDTAWNVATPVDTIVATSDRGYHIRALSLHGKLFLAFKSAQDRLHVRDAGSTSIRRVGLAEPAAPSVANSAPAGTYSGTRYFRVRYTVQSGGVTLRRSEPSDVTTFNPSGAKDGAVITKPASISESETHWEVEASLDNILFYRIATVVVGTTTYTDTTAFSTGYAVSGSLSEDVGDYTPLHSAKFIVADDDRVIVGGSWDNDAMSSRVAWTPVLNDPGVGNDERSPVDTNNFVDLDTREGGELTDLSRTVNGYIFAFKYDQIHQLTRTGLRTRAYTAHTLTKNRGAIEGSVVEGLDHNGAPCLYFLDPRFGPCRIGEGGVQSCGRDIRNTWNSVNKGAVVVSRSLFYQDSSQVHWWIATGASTTPDLLIVLHTAETRQMPNGIRRGWSKFNGNRAAAISCCMFSDNIEAGTARSLTLKPLIGKIDGTIHMCDTGTTDSGTAYNARIRSGPVKISPLQQFGLVAATTVAKAASGVTVVTKAIRDFGIETKTYDVLLTPAASEDPVVVQQDNFNISECYAVQIEFSDQASPSGSWNIQMFMAETRSEE